MLLFCTVNSVAVCQPRGGACEVPAMKKAWIYGKMVKWPYCTFKYDKVIR